MYESKNEPLLPTSQFTFRVIKHIFYALLVLLITVFIGVLGHIIFEQPISWHDALLNTAFIVGGMGAYIMPTTISGKVFFAIYSLFVSLVLIASLATILAPIAHRLIHKFHLDEDDSEDD